MDKNVIKAGVFVLSCVLLFLMIIFTLGKERRIFADQEVLLASIDDVGGLSVGAPVRLGGITVGRVGQIRFGADPSDSKVYMRLLVESKYFERIRKDSIVTIETRGLLGDKFVRINVSTNPTSVESVKSGDSLQTRELADVGEVMAKAQEVVDNTVAISEQVRKSLSGVEADSFQNFTEALNNISAIAQEIRNGNGLAHRLIYSDKEGKSVFDSVENTLATIDQIVSDVKDGQGLLNTLIYDPDGQVFVTSLTKAAQSLAETSDAITEMAKEIREGDGLMHQLVYGEAVDLTSRLNSTVAKLEAASDSLKRASDSLANGEGTMGALLVDSRVYDNLVEITDGARRSFILRQAIKSSLEK